MLLSLLSGLSSYPAWGKKRDGEPWEKYWTDKKYQKWQYSLPKDLSDSASYALGMIAADEFSVLIEDYDLKGILDDFTFPKLKQGCLALERGLVSETDVFNLLGMLKSGTSWEITLSGEGVKERPLLSRPVRKLKAPGEMLAFLIGYVGAQAMGAGERENSGLEYRPKMMFYGAFAQLMPGEWNVLMTRDERDAFEKRLRDIIGMDAAPEEAEEFDEEGFLEENGRRDGVVTLPSGLQYKVLREGDGKTPGPDDRVEIKQSTVLLHDHEAFEEGEEELEHNTGQVSDYLDGYAEGLQRMSAGAHYVFWIPTMLCNGRDGRIIEVEMLSVEEGDGDGDGDDEAHGEEDAFDEAAYLEKVAGQPGVRETSSGLLYKEIRPGTGPSPRLGDQVAIKHATSLFSEISGEELVDAEADFVFDNDFVTSYIDGVAEALQRMSVGAHCIFWVPSRLCNGWGGRIFEVELLDIIRKKFDEEAFLEGNRWKDGVEALPSGLQYRILENGQGATPGPKDTVELMIDTLGLSQYEEYGEYEEYAEDSRPFFSSGAVSDYMDGLQVGLQQMSRGARFLFWIPSSLCNGKEGQFVKVEMNGIRPFQKEEKGD